MKKEKITYMLGRKNLQLSGHEICNKKDIKKLKKTHPQWIVKIQESYTPITNKASLNRALKIQKEGECAIYDKKSKGYINIKDWPHFGSPFKNNTTVGYFIPLLIGGALCGGYGLVLGLMIDIVLRLTFWRDL